MESIYYDGVINIIVVVNQTVKPKSLFCFQLILLFTALTLFMAILVPFLPFNRYICNFNGNLYTWLLLVEVFVITLLGVLLSNWHILINSKNTVVIVVDDDDDELHFV